MKVAYGRQLHFLQKDYSKKLVDNYSTIRLCLKGFLPGPKVMGGLSGASEGLGSSRNLKEPSRNPPELGSLGFQGWFLRDLENLQDIEHVQGPQDRQGREDLPS